MANINPKSNNCVLEIGTVVGSKDITTEVQTGTQTIVQYNGCVDPGTYEDQGFNEGSGNIGERVMYKGIMPNTASNLGGTLQEMIGVGNIGTQACHLSYLSTWNGNSFLPGNGISDNKIVYINVYDDNLVPQNMPFINPVSTAGGVRFEPKNNKNYSHNVQGRSIYFVNNSKTQGSANTVTKREGVAFDVLGCFANNHLLLRGNGSDTMDDYSLSCPDMWTDPESHSYYISAYTHSMHWDSSGGSGNPFYWIGGSLTAKTHIGSYEGSQFRDASIGMKANDCFRGSGILGVRSDYWGMGAGVNSQDQYEVEIRVSQILNAKIDILQGAPYNNNIEPTNSNDLEITTSGTHKVCLSALQVSNVFGHTALNGGVLPMDNSRHFHASNGSINILNAKAIDENIPARITLDYIKITKRDSDIVTSTVPVMATEINYSVDQYQWDYLDLFKSETLPLAFTYSVGNLKDLSKRTTAYSKTFEVPANSHNNRILTPMLAVGSIKEKIDWMPCRVSVNGVNVFKGLMRVEKGITGNGGKYSCHIIDDSVDWKHLLEDREICQVPFGDGLDIKKSFASIINSWYHSPVDSVDGENIIDFKNNLDRNLFGDGNIFFQWGSPPTGKDYFYGLINYGQWHANSVNAADFNHNSNDFHPVIFAYRLIKKIFDTIGYSISSNFIESETFKRLCHPYSSGESYADDDLFGSEGSQYANVELNDKFPCGGTFSSGGKLKRNRTHGYWYPNLVPGVNLGNNWSQNASNQGYTTPFAGTYQVDLHGTLYISDNILSSGGYSWLQIELMKNGQVEAIAHKVFDNDNGVYDGIPDTQSFNVVCNAGDHLAYRIHGYNNDSTFAMWCDASHMKFLAFPLVSNTVPDQFINLSKVLPCTKQTDYLKGLTELFNLQWFADKEQRVVYVEPYDTFFGSGKVIDWTTRLDKKSWEDKFIAVELAQSVNFNYQRDTSDNGLESLYNWREDNDLNEYKSYTETNTKRFRRETLQFGTKIFSNTYRFNNYGLQPNPKVNSVDHPYAPGAYAWGDLSWNSPADNVGQNPLMPVMWNDEGGVINGYGRPAYNPTPKFKLRILNYYGVQETTPYDFRKGDGTIFTTSRYPHLGWINGWKKGFSKDEFNLSWDDYNDGSGYVSPGLFTKYWKNAYDKMNGGALVRTCNMALNAVDINNFDYRDIIHLKIDDVSTYWTVQSIKDYKPNNNQLTKVELIEWKYDANYASPTGSLFVDPNVNPPVEAEEDNGKDDAVPKSKTYATVEVKSKLKSIENAFTVDNNGKVELHGCELVVEEADGTICTLLYTEENDLKKLYTREEEKSLESTRNTQNINNRNNNY
jgi:hypothetical protein